MMLGGDRRRIHRERRRRARDVPAAFDTTTLEHRAVVADRGRDQHVAGAGRAADSRAVAPPLIAERRVPVAATEKAG